MDDDTRTPKLTPAGATDTHMPAGAPDTRMPARAPSRARTDKSDRILAEQDASAEYGALLAMLAGLTPQQWFARTECAPWTVREMVAHITGAAEEAVRLRVQLKHLWTARRAGGAMVDALNRQQISDREGRAPAELLAELGALAKRAPAARRRTPSPIRRRRLPPGAGGRPGDTMGYLLDVIYTRDIWMHRVDISRATGCALSRSGAEQRVVELIVADLADGWTGPACRLTLTGPGGGTWLLGAARAATSEGAEPDATITAAEDAAPTTPAINPDLPAVTLDAVAACRLWSGRSDETGLAVGTPVERALLNARILF